MTMAQPRAAQSGRSGVLYVWGMLLLVGCSEAPAPPAPPAAEVRVIRAEAAALTRVAEIPGRLQAVRTAEVRARVDGIVQERAYAEGTDVRANQVLFRIDPRELRAQLAAAEAALARAEATAANAEQDVKRYQGLVERQALSQQEYDAAVARSRTAAADVAATRAQVEAARLSLGYATVTAPISGRAGRAMVTEGALVNRGAGTLLTTIEQLDPIFVNFAESNTDVLQLRDAMQAGNLNGLQVHIVDGNGAVYPHAGRLNFLDFSIDQATGTTAMRAEFANPERMLLPGQFVRVRIESPVKVEGILVPQRAVTLSATGATVMVVNEKNVVEVRTVQVGQLKAGSWEIVSGIQAGERVLVDGTQKVQPGATVRVVMDSAAAVPDTAARAGSEPKAGR